MIINEYLRKFKNNCKANNNSAFSVIFNLQHYSKIEQLNSCIILQYWRSKAETPPPNYTEDVVRIPCFPGSSFQCPNYAVLVVWIPDHKGGLDCTLSPWNRCNFSMNRQVTQSLATQPLLKEAKLVLQ